jgi:exoribonuclease II
MTLNPLMTQQPFGIAPSKEEASRKVRKKSSTIGFGFDEVTVSRSFLSPPFDLKRIVQIVLNCNKIH